MVALQGGKPGNQVNMYLGIFGKNERRILTDISFFFFSG